MNPSLGQERSANYRVRWHMNRESSIVDAASFGCSGCSQTQSICEAGGCNSREGLFFYAYRPVTQCHNCRLGHGRAWEKKKKKVFPTCALWTNSIHDSWWLQLCKNLPLISTIMHQPIVSNFTALWTQHFPAPPPLKNHQWQWTQHFPGPLKKSSVTVNTQFPAPPSPP